MGLDDHVRCGVTLLWGLVPNKKNSWDEDETQAAW